MANRSSCPALRAEELEPREVPAILIQVDYTYDTGFFSNNPEARATMERVAAELGDGLSANLSAIAPGGGNTWTATFYNPTTGALQTLTDLAVGANTIRLFVGARPLGGGEAGFATTTGFNASGSSGWVDTVQTRGHTGFAPWGGSIAFDSTIKWHFGSTTAGLDASELDFYSVAAHELGHVLGIGTAPQWHNLISGGAFRGASAMEAYGGPVPVDADGDHWAEGITVGGRVVSLDPTLAYGQRVWLSALETAALRDLGWTGGGAASAVPPGMTLFAVAGAGGVMSQYAIYQGVMFPTGRQFVPFPGLGGALQQTFGDFDGDGSFDVAIATPGGVGAMAVISGLDGRVIGAPRLAHGGVAALFAADLDGDGRAELITQETFGPGASGVYVYRVLGGGLQPYGAVSAHGEPGRAAARVAGGDVDRHGHHDAIALAPAASDHANEGIPASYFEDEHDHGTAGAHAPAEPHRPVGAADEREHAHPAPAAEPCRADSVWRDELLTAVWVG